MTKFFKSKGKKKEEVTAPVPRETKVIVEQYNQLKARAGEVQYLLYIHGKELEQLNQAMENLNYEGGARAKLDKETADAKPEASA